MRVSWFYPNIIQTINPTPVLTIKYNKLYTIILKTNKKLQLSSRLVLNCNFFISGKIFIFLTTKTSELFLHKGHFSLYPYSLYCSMQ